MIKKFDKNKSYIFSRERYIETSGILSIDEKEWYDRIDGVEVEVVNEDTGKCWDYLVLCSWCEEMDKSPKINLQVNEKEKDMIIQALDFLNNNCLLEYTQEEYELLENLLRKFCK